MPPLRFATGIALLARSLSLSLPAMPARHINASCARAREQQCKCSRFRLTFLSFPARLRNHSHYFAALMSRSRVQLPRRQKFPLARCGNARLFFAVPAIIATRASENISSRRDSGYITCASEVQSEVETKDWVDSSICKVSIRWFDAWWYP